jgi:hypothetical protein
MRRIKKENKLTRARNEPEDVITRAVLTHRIVLRLLIDSNPMCVSLVYEMKPRS